MTRPTIAVRPATLDDLARIVQVDAESWPPPLAASTDQVRSRIEMFSAGQLVAVVDGEVAGVIFAQRLTGRFFSESPPVWDVLTDGGTFAHSHDAAGEVFQIVGVGVARAARGLQLGRTLVDAEIALARSLPGVRRILGFTRPADYHRRPELPIEQYVELRDEQGRRADRVLSFHLDSGARLVGVHPGFRPADVEAAGYGVLIEYPVIPESASR